MGTWTGWLAFAAIAVAGAIPTLYRLFLRRRASPLSRALGWHASVGALAGVVVLLHVGAAMPDLGDPSVVRAGNLALLPAVLAAFLVVAHVGVGLRLRSPKCPARVRLRRTHAVLATTIVVAASAHVVALLAAR